MKFETDDYNHEKINEWMQEHVLTCKLWQPNEEGFLPQGAAGGALTYCFTPTGIGLAVEIRCACGESKNVTDYEDW